MLKVDFIFNAQITPNGWVESWYYNGSLDDEKVMDVLVNLAIDRNLALGWGATLVAIRVRDLAVRGSTQIRAVPDTRKHRVGEENCDDVHMGWEFAVRGNAVGGAGTRGYYRRNYFMRGIPRDAVAGDASSGFTLGKAWRKDMNQWHKTLKANFKMMALDKTAAEKDLISAIEDPNGKGVQFSTGAILHGLKAGQPVHIYKCRYGWKPCNGTYAVFAVPDPFHFVVRAPVGEGPFLLGGVVKPRTYVFPDVDFLEDTRPLRKSTGKPFFGTHGKTKTKGSLII